MFVEKDEIPDRVERFREVLEPGFRLLNPSETARLQGNEYSKKLLKWINISNYNNSIQCL